MMPLTMGETGKVYTIEKVGGGPQTKKHLEDIGFYAGGNVEIISATCGNLIVAVKDSRIALDRDLAKKIMV